STITTMEDSVVITGVSGRFPESENVAEFWENLLNKVDMVTEDGRRWKPGLWGMPKRSGKLKNLDKLDASFFDIHPKQANNMCPQLRTLLEVTYEAIENAGVNPAHLAGTRTGWVGITTAEVKETLTRDHETTEGYTMTGTFNSMFANRLSYYFDLKGPSVSMDTACSSSMMALHMAFAAIKAGKCDAAVVGGTNVIFKPQGTLMCHRFNMLSLDGSCKTFDASANGYVRAEAVGAIFIQKKSAARRIYCEVLNANTNSDGRKAEGITYPSGNRTQQAKLLEETYKECGINPNQVHYVEAHGTGTPAGDLQELTAIDKVMCADRKVPILVGSLKSNMGHSESASGVCSLVKCAVALRMGVIPPNLHYMTPNPNIKVIIGVNSFGFGGSNVHAVLRSCEERPMVDVPNQPTLTLITGRTEQGIKGKVIHCQIKLSRERAYFSSFMNKLSTVDPARHPYRGYTINMQDENREPIQEYAETKEQREIWYICSGMGSQWEEMGKSLLGIPIFLQAIDKCTAALNKYNFNVKDMIENSDSTTFGGVINSIVGITAIQIGLIDILTSLGIKPTGIVGHSMGEVACSYADECLTLEQTIEVAYLRGKCITDAKLPPGRMAAVGLTWQECIEQCYGSTVAPACHNSHDSVTITGPDNDVFKMVEKLKNQRIFARVVETNGIAYHSNHMQLVYPSYLEELRKVIPNPNRRSKLWLTTSAKDAEGASNYLNDVLFCSAEYHANNLGNTVQFHNAVKKIPDEVIVIEIAPNASLQPVLRRSLSSTCERVVLTDRKERNGIETLYKGIGQLHCLGVNCKVEAIAPNLTLPSPRDLLQIPTDWDHDQSWYMPKEEDFINSSGSGNSNLESHYTIDISAESKYHYLRGHIIDGRLILPITAYLHFVWQSLARYHQVELEDLPVQFDEIKLHRATTLQDSVELVVQIIPSTNEFRVTEGGNLLSTGSIQRYEGTIEKFEKLPQNGENYLTQKEIHRKLRLIGYHYKGDFQSLQLAKQNGQYGEVYFGGNYPPFIDSILQLFVIESGIQGMKLPLHIKQVQLIPVPKDLHGSRIPVKINRDLAAVTASGFVHVTGFQTVNTSRRARIDQPLVNKYVFVPNVETNLSKHDDEALQYERILQDYLGTYATIFSKYLTLSNGGTYAVKDRSYFENFEQSFPNAHFLRLLMTMTKNEESCSDERYYEPLFGHNYCLYSLDQTNGPVLVDGGTLEKLIKEHVPTLMADPLLNYCVSNSNILKSSLDVFLENCGNFVKLAELPNTYFGNHQDLISNQFNASPMVMRYNYFGLCGNASQDASIQWNPRTDAKAPPEVQNLNLVVCNKVFQHGMSVILLQNFCHGNGSGFHLQGRLSQIFLNKTLLYHWLHIHFYTTKNLNLCYTFRQIKEILESLNLEIITHKADGNFGSDLLLCRTRIQQSTPRVIQIDHNVDGFNWVDTIKKSMVAKENMWLAANSWSNGLAGMIKCVNKEAAGSFKIRSVYNKNSIISVYNKKLLGNKGSIDDVIGKNLVINVFKNGHWGTFRHTEIALQTHAKSPRACIKNTVKGETSSLQWVVMKSKPSESPECRVAYAALNENDLLLASGKMDARDNSGNFKLSEAGLGIEFSGYDKLNRKVMGIIQEGGLATHISVDTRFLWNIPDHWTLSEAASVPYAYIIAYYALTLKGKITEGKTLLIHNGSSPIGEASIAIALGHGCTVFTTVTSVESKTYLLQKFSKITEKNVFLALNNTMSENVKAETNGKGIEIYLVVSTSSSYEDSEQMMKCVAKHGRIVQIVGHDTPSNIPLGSLKTVSYHFVHVGSLFDNDDILKWEKAGKLLKEGIKSGVVQPLKSVMFQRHQIKEAFHHTEKTKYMEKVLIQVEDSNLNVDYNFRIYRTTFDPCKTYIITGGLGGFGLELCNWMVTRGAKNIVLTTRSGANTAYQQMYIKQWRSEGVTITVSTAQVNTEEGTKQLLNKDVAGIFHLAMVLRDAVIMNQSPKNFEEVCRPKCDGIKNLDRYSRQLCPDLQHFVVFSSVGSGIGNAGQTNYGYANSFMERVCEERKREGYPALAIQWGAVGDVGVAIETIGEKSVAGSFPQSMRSCLKTLDIFLSQCSDVTVLSMVLAPKENSMTQSLKKENKTVARTVADIMGIKTVRPSERKVPLTNFGLDSLMAVEISQLLERDFGVQLGTQEVQNITFAELEKIKADKVEMEISIPIQDNNDQPAEETREIVPSEVIIKLNDSKETNGLPWHFIHPIGGSSIVLKTIAKNLNSEAFGLNFTSQAPITSIRDLAAHYLQVIGKHECYNIVGYSFGASVALEMAMQVSKQGRNIKLVLIDGSH
uniref:Fatty acid synthase n=1 Tax=Ciona savignyi TaxID=51511 RepID=H2Z2A8_CIOSA